MKTDNDWRRVTKEHPCPRCGKPDWCVISKTTVLCMRVQSNRPSKGEAGGWLHPLDTDRVELPPKEPKKPTIDAAQIISDWAERTKAEWVQAFAKQLGVSYTALACLGCCWSPGHRAWAFPMKDGHERTVGIRLRSVDGKKWAVPGSHAGLFIPQTK